MYSNRPNWLHSRLYPELRLFPSEDTRRSAEREAFRRTIKNPQFILRLVATILLLMAVRWLAQTLNLVNGLIGELVAWLAVFVMAGVSAPWIIPISSIRRMLRNRLRESGIPVCDNCGYQLAGLDGDRCPECGRLIMESVGDDETGK